MRLYVLSFAPFALLIGYSKFGGLLELEGPLSWAPLAVAMLASLALAFSVAWIPIVYNVRSLLRRRLTTTVTILGMALVVYVFASAQMLRQGIRATLGASGQENNVVVLRDGATSEITSAVEREALKLLAAMPEVAIDPADGQPLADGQMSVLIFAQRTGGDTTDGANVTVRGVSPKALALHDATQVIEGRFLTPGTSEIVIGKALVGNFNGAQLGGEISFARRSWKVVGVMAAGGASYESEIWADVEQAMAAFQRPVYSTVTMRVKDPAQIPAMAAQVAADPRLSLEMKQERKYFEDLSNATGTYLGIIGLVVSIVFSFAAALGAMISMYGQVAARTREIGTLRALGFQRESVLVSFLIESLLLGLLSGAIGLGCSSLMRFATFHTMNFDTFSEVTFRFTLTGDVVTRSVVFAAIMGYVGGLFPAVRAARMAIVDATRGG